MGYFYQNSNKYKIIYLIIRGIYGIFIKILVLFVLFFFGTSTFSATVFYDSVFFKNFTTSYITQFSLLFNDSVLDVYMSVTNNKSGGKWLLTIIYFVFNWLFFVGIMMYIIISIVQTTYHYTIFIIKNPRYTNSDHKKITAQEYIRNEFLKYAFDQDEYYNNKEFKDKLNYKNLDSFEEKRSNLLAMINHMAVGDIFMENTNNKDINDIYNYDSTSKKSFVKQEHKNKDIILENNNFYKHRINKDYRHASYNCFNNKYKKMFNLTNNSKHKENNLFKLNNNNKNSLLNDSTNYLKNKEFLYCKSNKFDYKINNINKDYNYSKSEISNYNSSISSTNKVSECKIKDISSQELSYKFNNLNREYQSKIIFKEILWKKNELNFKKFNIFNNTFINLSNMINNISNTITSKKFVSQIKDTSIKATIQNKIYSTLILLYKLKENMFLV